MDKELIERIKSQLQEHEEAYSLGAWERFAKKDRKRRGFVYWPLWTAAAIILVCLGLFIVQNQRNSQNEIVLSKPKTDTVALQQTPFHSQKNIADIKIKTTVDTVTSTNSKHARNFNNHTPKAFPLEAKYSMIAKDDFMPKTDFVLSPTSILAQLPISLNPDLQFRREKKETTIAHSLTFEEMLARDSKSQQTKTVKKDLKDSKWESGIYVAPSVGNDSKVNVNYGFSLSYAVANKLSISSGVSYASLSSSETLNNFSTQTIAEKSLGGVTAKVSGINVPLELRYKISDRLYTGIGVSALAVLNNSQNNTYLSNQVQTFASPSAALALNAKRYIVQEKSIEMQSPSSANPDPFIGFYNFSLGYRQKISKKNNIAIEPFLQLPMKTFSKENLNLTNGGVRLKFDF